MCVRVCVSQFEIKDFQRLKVTLSYSLSAQPGCYESSALRRTLKLLYAQPIKLQQYYSSHCGEQYACKGHRAKIQKGIKCRFLQVTRTEQSAAFD